MKKIIIAFLLIIFSISDLAYSIHPVKLNIDSTIRTKNFELIESLNIEENDSVILNNIISINICQKNRFILTNDADRTAILYDYKNGKIVKSISPLKEYADSIAFSDVKPFLIAGKNLRYMRSNEYKSKGLTDLGINMIKSIYFTTYCIEDVIKILCLVYLPATSDTEDFNAVDNRTILLDFNDNLEYEKFTILEVNEKSYPIPTVLSIMNNGNIITCAPNFNHKKSSFDSIVTLSIHNQKGKFLHNIGYLPQKFIINNLTYIDNWFPFVTNISDSIYISYPLDNVVYEPNQKISFTLKNLPFNNDSALSYLSKYYKSVTLNGEIVDKQYISNLVPQQIVYTFNANKKLGFIIQIIDNLNSNSKYYIIQEYDLDGTLLSHTKIYDEPENQIRNFVFDKYNGFLCLIKKNKTSWTLEKRKW